MTAPAEDPRGGEALRSQWCASGIHRTCRIPGCECDCHPAAGRGDTDSGGEVTWRLAQAQDDARAIAEARADLARPAVVAHNHVTFDIKPAGECPACDQYARVNWAYPSARPAARPAGDRAQPTEGLREAIRQTIDDDQADGWQRSTPEQLTNRVLALPAVVALLDAQAAVKRVRELADELQLWKQMAERHADEWPEDDHRRSTALGRAMGYQRSVLRIRRALGGTT